jgi:hypothetical protein
MAAIFSDFEAFGVETKNQVLLLHLTYMKITKITNMILQKLIQMNFFTHDLLHSEHGKAMAKN